jgi:putative phosphoribosyl transferase
MMELEMNRFTNRAEAGRQLATLLHPYGNRKDVVVLALPRGGVPVAFEVARALHAPLDVFVVRKLGMPAHPEFAIGAIASGGVRVLNHDLIDGLDISAATVDALAEREQLELDRQERLFRGDRPLADVRDKTVLLIDDGLATGSTMKAAVQALRAEGPKSIVVAVPVGAPDSCAEMETIADAVVCARTPDEFSAVGKWYVDFTQTSDAEVRGLLQGVDDHAGRRR